MPTVRPHHVQVREGFDPKAKWSPRRLLYATDPERAAMRSMHWDDGEFMWSRRRGFLQRGLVYAVEVRAYRITDIATSKSWLVHAEDADTARSRVASAFTASAPALVAVAADELDILATFSGAELLRLVSTLWQNKDPLRRFERHQPAAGAPATSTRQFGHKKLRRSEMYYRVPSLYRLCWLSKRRNLDANERLLAAYAIRLAMLIPGFGPAGEPVTRNESTRYRHHAKNVSARVIARCRKHGLDELDPFTDPQRAALVTLATEYGYDAHSLSDLELLSLWQRGPS